MASESLVIGDIAGRAMKEHIAHEQLNIEGSDAETVNSYKYLDVLRTNELPDGIDVFEGILGYPWHIDTKYYTADVLLSVAHTKTIGDKQFADRVHAFILCVDVNEENCLEKAQSWLPFVKELEPPIQLLIADCLCETSAITRESAITWCLDSGFEFIELNPVLTSGDENSDVDDDFVETVGIARVVEAMKAHMWPNLVMKEKPDIRGTYFKQLMAEEARKQKESTDNDAEDLGEPEENTASENKPENSDESKPSVSEPSNCRKQENSHSSNIQESLPEASSRDDGLPLDMNSFNSGSPQSNFEEMFEQLRVMKDRVTELPHEERKLYAEKIVTQFWRAIGGDEDELEGLDSD